MKKNYIKYAVAALIGVSSVIYCTEQTLDKNDSVTVSAKIENVEPAVLSSNTSPVAITAVTTQIPTLVPFNFDAYQLCCEKRQLYHRGAILKTVLKSINASQVLIAVSIPLLLSYTPISTVGFQFITKFMSQAWYQKIFTVFKTPVAAAWVLFGFLANCKKLIGYTNNFMYEGHFKNRLLWEEREVVASSIKQQIWHKEIYARFGHPTIEGVAPTVGTYHIVGEKKCGAGKVIFDPFDLNQVKILLGIHDTITEDLQCTKVTIVPSI